MLREAHRRKGKILIPSFALERTQDVLFHLARLEEAGEIEPMPVYVDSPLASRVEDVYQACMDEMADNVRQIAASGKDPFAPARLMYTKTVEDSKKINASHEAAIIIAGSGMMTGGRILHHLRAHLDDTHTTVMIVGFQPTGGLGRLLVDGRPEVRIMGETVSSRHGSSQSAACRPMPTAPSCWTGRRAPVRPSFRVVHGEPHALEALRGQLADRGFGAEIQKSEVWLPETGRKDEGGE